MNSEQIKAQISTFIDEYVGLEHKSAIYRAQGSPIPVAITLRMEGLAAWGRAHINPNSFHHVIQEKDRRLSERFIQASGMQQQQNALSNKQLIDNATRKVTKGMLGQPHLTSNQLAAIVNNQPLRARIPNKEYTQEQKDAQVRAFTRQFDPRGVGFDEKQYTKIMDTLTDAADSDPEEFSKLCFKFNNSDPAKVRRECEQWKLKRAEFGLKRKQRERDEARGKIDNPMLNKGDRKVSDSEHRKATLATAMIADSIDQSERGDSESFNSLSERSDIHRSYLEDTGRRGEMARAFEKVESIGYDG